MSRRAPLLVLIVTLVIAGVIVALLVLPKLGDVRDAEDELDAARAREQQLRIELSRLEELAEDEAQLRRELARFRRAVPSVADLPGIISQVQNAADISGVDFFSISPGTPAGVGEASEIPVQIQVIGNFFPVDEFLLRLESLPRASKSVSITVAAGPENLPQIDVQMEARFYTTDLEAGPGTGVETETAPTEAPESPAPTESPGGDDVPT